MKRILKITGIVILALVVGLLLLRVYVGSVLKQAISDQVTFASHNRYHLSIEKVSIGFLAVNATITGINLVCDTLQPMADSVPLCVNLKTHKIRLRNLDLIDLVKNKRLTISRFEIEQPTLQVILNPAFKAKPEQNNALKLFHLNIGDFTMSDAVLKVKTKTGKTYKFSIGELNYNLKSNEFTAFEFGIFNSENQNDSLHLSIDKINLQGFNMDNLIDNNVLDYAAAEIKKINIRVVHTSKNFEDKDSVLKGEPTNFIGLKFKTNPFNIDESHVVIINQKDTQVVNVSHILFANNKLNLKDVGVQINNANSTEIKSQKVEVILLDNLSIVSLQRLMIKSILVEQPIINVTIGTKRKEQGSGQSGFFPPVTIDRFTINKASLTVNFLNSKSQRVSIRNATINCTNIRLNSDTVYNTKLQFTDLDMAASGIEFNTKSNLYHLSATEFRYGYRKDEMSITNFILKSNYDRDKFYKIVKKQIPVINLNAASIKVEKFDLAGLVNQNQIHCAVVTINKLVAGLYKDKRIPLDSNDIRKMPQKLIRDAGISFNIEKIRILNSTITSEVFGENSLSSGTIVIDKVQLEAYRICNIAALLTQNDVMRVVFSGRLAQQGTLTAQAVFPLLSSKNEYTVTAEIGVMPLKSLNNFISDVTHVSINTGTLDNAIVVLKGTDTEIKTDLKMRYHNLNVTVLNYKKEGKSASLKLVTNLANMMIINNNPEVGKAIRETEITTAYEPIKFIINNWIAASLKAMLVTLSPSAAKAINVRNEKNIDNETIKGRKKKTFISRILEKNKNK